MENKIIIIIIIIIHRHSRNNYAKVYNLVIIMLEFIIFTFVINWKAFPHEIHI